MDKEKRIKKEITFLKYEAKKRLVYGIVYAPDIPDAQDQYMNSDTIEKSAHSFMIASRQSDHQHDFVKGAAIPVESFIVREGDRDFVDKSGNALVGAWVLGVKVMDEAIWKQIIKGEIKAFSLAGVAQFGEERDMYSEWYDDEGNYKSLWEED